MIRTDGMISSSSDDERFSGGSAPGALLYVNIKPSIHPGTQSDRPAYALHCA